MKSTFLNHVTFAAVATTIVVASPAIAQTPATAAPAAAPTGPVCEIEQGKPQSVARASFSLARAQQAMKGGDPTKDLRDMVSTLSAPNAGSDNPIGRAYLLGTAYVFLLEQPAIQPVSLRSAVGLATNPTGTIDLFAAADSAITVVEQSSAACAEYMAPFRQQKAWLNVTNAAINALNANQLDSAEIFARRSLTLDRKSPYAYSVLASIAKTRKNYPAMAEYAKQTIAATGTDSTYADVRDRMLYDVAATTTLRAESASAAEKRAIAREAVTAWNNLLVSSKDEIHATTAVANLPKLYVAAGDSASIPKIYAAMIADPSKFSESALLQAGVVASQHKRAGDAALLFAAVVARNPYQRDALNNLAASYIFTGDFDKVLPVVGKLTSLDPSNPDNWMLYAFTYAGMLKGTKAARLTKAYTDSLTFYNDKADKMGVKVSFTEFSRNDQGTTLAGRIENKGTIGKTYSLAVDFLDSKGSVLFTETASVGPVAPKASKEFTLKNAKTGVAGFRYKPII